VLRRVDAQARRALVTQETGDVRELIRLYQVALSEIALQVAGAWEQIDEGPDAGRDRFLRWKIAQEEQLMNGIQGRLDHLQRQLVDGITVALVEAYEEKFSRDAYALDQATPPSMAVDISGGSQDQAFNSIVNTPWKGAMFSERIWLLTDDMKNEIRNQLGLSVLLGESVDEAKRRIKNLKVLGNNVPADYAIERLVRTEILKAHDRAAERLHQDNEDVIEEEIVQATLDTRTDEDCADLDDLPLESEEAQLIIESAGFERRPPFHPNCRCRILARPKKWDLLLSIGKLDVPTDLDRFPKEERVIRDPSTGRSRLVPFMTYSEWRELRGVVGSRR